MGAHIKASPDFLKSCSDDFNRTVSFIKDHFHEESFYNLQKDNSKYRKKLYPTVFDSLMIATSIALKRGYVYKGEDWKTSRSVSQWYWNKFSKCF